MKWCPFVKDGAVENRDTAIEVLSSDCPLRAERQRISGPSTSIGIGMSMSMNISMSMSIFMTPLPRPSGFVLVSKQPTQKTNYSSPHAPVPSFPHPLPSEQSFPLGLCRLSAGIARRGRPLLTRCA